MNKILLVFFLLVSTSVATQFDIESHRNIRETVENRDYEAAIMILQKLRQSDKKTFELNNYDYLIARLFEKQNNFAEAAANYQSIVNRKSVLTEYALWHLADISLATGNLFLERIYLRELLATAPESLISDAAKTRLARSSFESKDFNLAIAEIKADANFGDDASNANFSETRIFYDTVFGNLNASEAKFRENLVFLGKAYSQGDNQKAARAVFSKLVDVIPYPTQPDDFALEGVRGLDMLEVGSENFGKIAPELSDSEHLKRADIYQFNRNFLNARLHYQSLVERFSKSPNVPLAMYRIGRGFMQERNFTSAASWFERIQGEFPESSVAKDALYQSAAAYAHVEKYQESVMRYQEFIELNRTGANVDRAYLNIVDNMRDIGDTSSALKWTAKTREDFRDKTPEAVAIFAQVRIHISQKDWQKALIDLESLLLVGNLGGAEVPGGTSKEEIVFLKGYVLEQLNRIDEAIEGYLSIPDGRRSYYGWRATERLKVLSNDKKTVSNIESNLQKLQASSGISLPDEKRKILQSIYRLTSNSDTLNAISSIYSELPEYRTIPDPTLLEFGRKDVLTESAQKSTNFHQTLANELLFLGLYDEGTPELEFAWQTDKKSPSDNEKFTIAVLFARGDMANRSVAYFEPLWRKIPDDYQLELIPKEQLKLLFPTPYIDSLLKFAPPRKIDPRFVLSIMRQEARFQANVKSVAAARGLMQFISSTSNQIAIELKRENFDQNELYNPPTAILFGSQYLSNLFLQFPDQPQAVAASYNGGEDNMARWFARAASKDPDMYVPEILYAQSKDYVYKVMVNFRIYQMLYDENLKPKTFEK